MPFADVSNQIVPAVDRRGSGRANEARDLPQAAPRFDTLSRKNAIDSMVARRRAKPKPAGLVAD